MSGLRRAGGEEGVALVIAVMSMMLMTALGSALVLTTMTETMVAANYVSGLEAFYAADAEIERTLSDLSGLSDWHPLIGLRIERAAPPHVRVVVTVTAGGAEGQVVVRAAAYAPRDIERTVEATVAHTDEVGPASVRLVGWREVR